MHKPLQVQSPKDPQPNYCDVVDGQVTKLHSSFPWASLKAGKVVDIGGGSGHISIGLARVSRLRLTLQSTTDK